MYAIKNILAGHIVRMDWPDLVNKDEGKREKWAAREISIDHPARRAEAVRDPTTQARRRTRAALLTG